jgi:hypothetical protein
MTPAVLLPAAEFQKAPAEGVTARDRWGLIVVGVLITVLWLGFRRLEHLSDEPEDRAGDRKP